MVGKSSRAIGTLAKRLGGVIEEAEFSMTGGSLVLSQVTRRSGVGLGFRVWVFETITAHPIERERVPLWYAYSL